MKPHAFFAALLAALAVADGFAADPVARRKPALALTDGEIKYVQVLISPDGKLVAASGEDGQIRLWSIKTGKLLHKLDERPRRIDPYDMQFSLDGKELAVASRRMKDDASGYLDEQIS